MVRYVAAAVLFLVGLAFFAIDIASRETYQHTGSTAQQYQELTELVITTSTVVSTPPTSVVNEPETIRSTAYDIRETRPQAGEPGTMAPPILEYIHEEVWPVTQESRNEKEADPPIGSALWWPIGGSYEFAGPGERGLIKITSHLNAGNPHENIVDDHWDDPSSGDNDFGLAIDDPIVFGLADLTRCEYRVIEPLNTGKDEELGIYKVPVPGSDTEFQPAVYHMKGWHRERIVEWVNLVGDRSVVMLLASYGGPSGRELVDGSRIYNSVVFAELVACNGVNGE